MGDVDWLSREPSHLDATVQDEPVQMVDILPLEEESVGKNPIMAGEIRPFHSDPGSKVRKGETIAQKVLQLLEEYLRNHNLPEEKAATEALVKKASTWRKWATRQQKPASKKNPYKSRNLGDRAARMKIVKALTEWHQGRQPVGPPVSASRAVGRIFPDRAVAPRPAEVEAPSQNAEEASSRSSRLQGRRDGRDGSARKMREQCESEIFGQEPGEVDMEKVSPYFDPATGSFVEAQYADPNIQKVIRVLDPSALEDRVDLCVEDLEAKEMIRKWRLSIKSGSDVVGSSDARSGKWRPWIPSSLVANILFLAHDHALAGHPGIQKTKSRIRDRFWWPQWEKDVIRWCNLCACSKFKVTQQPRRKRTHGFARYALFECIHADVVGPFPRSARGNRYWLTLIDRFSRDLELVPLRDATARTVSRAIFNEWICRRGCPRYLVSDNGSAFVSAVLHELMETLGTEQIYAAPYTHTTNGLCERVHRFAEATLRACLDHEGEPAYARWDDYLPSVRFAIVTSTIANHQVSSFEVVHGVRPRLPLDLEVGWEQRMTEDLDVYFKNMLEMYSNVRERFQQADFANQEKTRLLRDRAQNRYDPALSEGDWVYVARPPPTTENEKFSRKVRGKYEGPGQIVQVDPSTGRARVELKRGSRVVIKDVGAEHLARDPADGQAVRRPHPQAVRLRRRQRESVEASVAKSREKPPLRVAERLSSSERSSPSEVVPLSGDQMELKYQTPPRGPVRKLHFGPFQTPSPAVTRALGKKRARSERAFQKSRPSQAVMSDGKATGSARGLWGRAKRRRTEETPLVFNAEQRPEWLEEVAQERSDPTPASLLRAQEVKEHLEYFPQYASPSQLCDAVGTSVWDTVPYGHWVLISEVDPSEEAKVFLALKDGQDQAWIHQYLGRSRRKPLPVYYQAEKDKQGQERAIAERLGALKRGKKPSHTATLQKGWRPYCVGAEQLRGDLGWAVLASAPQAQSLRGKFDEFSEAGVTQER